MDIGSACRHGATQDLLEGLHEAAVAFISGARFEQAVELRQAKLRPSFHGLAPRLQFLPIQKAEIGDHRLAFAHLFGFEVEDMDDAEVDAAHFVRVVVQQRRDTVS